MADLVSEFVLWQTQELAALCRQNDVDSNQELVCHLKEQIQDLQYENSNLRAALELKDIELERCRAVQECEKEKAREKDSEKSESGFKSSKDRLEKLESHRKIAQLKKENEEKDVEIRQLKSRMNFLKDSHKKQNDAECMKHQQEIYILQQLLKEARSATSLSPQR